MLGYYVELIKGLEEADKVHVLDILAHASRSCWAGTAHNYKTGIGYNYFCEEPLCDQSNHTACSSIHNIILCVMHCSKSITSDHVPMYMLNLPPYFKSYFSLIHVDSKITVRQMIQGCMLDSKINYCNAIQVFLLRMRLVYLWKKVKKTKSEFCLYLQPYSGQPNNNAFSTVHSTAN